MKLDLLLFMCVAVVSGQFINVEYNLDSTPLYLRRMLKSNMYEAQETENQEIEQQDYTSRASSQGRRHTESHHSRNIQVDTINRNINEFDTAPFFNENLGSVRLSEYQLKGNRGKHINDQQYARIQQQNSENKVKDSSSDNAGHRSNTKINYDDANLKTNLDTNSLKNRQASVGQTSTLQQSYPSNDNVKINQNPTNQQNDRNYQNRQNEPLSKANDNNRNFETPNQDLPNEENFATSHNVRIPDYLQNEGDKEIKENRFTADENTETSVRKVNYDNRQNTEPPRTNNRNDGFYLNSAKPGYRREDSYEHKQTTQSSKSGDRVNFSTKPAEDNELTSILYHGDPGSRGDNQWLWSTEPALPTVDDRAAFDGDKCPTGKIRFNNVCVTKH